MEGGAGARVTTGCTFVIYHLKFSFMRRVKMMMTWVSVSVVCSVVGGELADELSSMLPDDHDSSLQRFTLRLPQLYT